MKLLVILYVTALVVAAPPPSTTNPENSKNVEILKFYNDNSGLGTYNFGYEQSDGTRQEQLGEINNVDSETGSLRVKGSFTWIGPDGVSYTVTYVANEDGYNPQIEQGPGGAVPAGVLASLAG
ncbi:hypothetical protein K1T71_004503 [Dendrolimus kikuchii]|uniref:Uncharacterized protein n=1 Tax=Dendrolimus kikuchii TaxID=765133 RepID=A0ACC1D7S5_9NEOP|nr:hypothetical protein K1T71_004503 [Dendrolimus kikuchii]